MGAMGAGASSGSVVMDASFQPMVCKQYTPRQRTRRRMRYTPRCRRFGSPWQRARGGWSLGWRVARNMRGHPSLKRNLLASVKKRPLWQTETAAIVSMGTRDLRFLQRYGRNTGRQAPLRLPKRPFFDT
ncbi:hypothetical protein CE91St32_28110 [Gordonibacter pamelaeae]|nr:hypothetical protein CE91St32_28110 [Gordonibacter pamelaeae]